MVGQIGLIISSKEFYADAVKQYAAIIYKEAVGGWKLDCIQEIPVTKSAGCVSSLLGKKDETICFNMLIFCKED